MIYPDLNPRAEKPSAKDEKPSPGEMLPAPPAELKSDKKQAPPDATAVPPEPPRIPQPDTGVMLPKQRLLARQWTGLFQHREPGSPAGIRSAPGVQAATYQRPAGLPPKATARRLSAQSQRPGGVAPAVYDAPPQYPVTQQSINR